MLKISDKQHFQRFRPLFFFGLIAALTILLLIVVRPFFYSVFWAGVVAIMFHPLHLAFNRALKLPGISALLTMIVAIVVIFLPLSIIAVLVVQESIRLYAMIGSGHFLAQIRDIAAVLEHTPVGPYILEVKENWAASATDATKTIAIFVVGHITAITQHSIRLLFLFFIMLYTLFFFLRDGGKILRSLKHFSPLDSAHEDLLYRRFTSTVRATLKSTFIIGGVQGTLAAILFWATGVQGAFLWAVILFGFSMIPGIGAFTVWLPVGITSILLGNTWQGITILLVGFFLLSIIDNLLRPPLIGKDTQMHPLLVLLSSLGGILLFGIAGFVIGPIIAALYLSVMAIYEDYYSKELEHSEK